jgi:hypothetical protein
VAADTENTEPQPPKEEPAINDRLREGLVELEAYLEGLPPDEVSQAILPLASTWVLEDVGFDLDRYAEEARVFVDATPEHDQVLNSFPDAITYYVALRLTMTADDQIDAAGARAHLDKARAEVEQRAQLLDEEGFTRVAAAFRRLLEETAETSPPEDRLWRALALRIGERQIRNPNVARRWR